MTMTSDQHRALIVDDDQVWIKVIAEELTQAGFAVQSAGDPTTALELVSQNRFAVVVADMDLPGDIPETYREKYKYVGIWLIERIRELDPLANIIVLTGHGSVRLANDTFRRGIFAYLLKNAALP